MSILQTTELKKYYGIKAQYYESTGWRDPIH